MRLGALIHGLFAPSHADRAPIAQGLVVAGSATSTVTCARSPEADSCSSLKPLRRGSSVTSVCESEAAVATRPIDRPLVVATKSSSLVRFPYASRATTRSTTLSRDRTATRPAGAPPRSTTSSCAGPGSAYTVAVRLNVPTLAVISNGPARSGSATRTRTVPVASVSAAVGVTAPPDTANVTGCFVMGAPVESRTSSLRGLRIPQGPLLRDTRRRGNGGP